MDYICTKFGVDSSSRFSCTVGHGDRQTHKSRMPSDHPTDASTSAGVVGSKKQVLMPWFHVQFIVCNVLQFSVQ